MKKYNGLNYYTIKIPIIEGKEIRTKFYNRVEMFQRFEKKISTDVKGWELQKIETLNKKNCHKILKRKRYRMFPYRWNGLESFKIKPNFQ